MKQEIRLLKQEIDLQPKDRRKDEFRKRRGLMDIQHEEKERAFLQSLSESHELALRRLSEKHRDRLATIDKNFLQQKQTVVNRQKFILISGFPIIDLVLLIQFHFFFSVSFQ